MCSGPAAAGAIARRFMALAPRSSTASTVGASRASGEGCSSSSPPAAGFLRSSPSTPPTSRSTARRGDPKKGDAIQAVGRSRGGRTSKIHALADDLGRPVAFTLTPGNIADISVARELLDTLAPPKRLLADKAYDADHLRDWLKARRVQAVIPSNATRRTPYPLDKIPYKRRNLIERMFCRLKDWRRIATRYDRTARNFLSAVALAATLSFWAK